MGSSLYLHEPGTFVPLAMMSTHRQRQTAATFRKVLPRNVLTEPTASASITQAPARAMVASLSGNSLYPAQGAAIGLVGSASARRGACSYDMFAGTPT